MINITMYSSSLKLQNICNIAHAHCLSIYIDKAIAKTYINITC